MKTPHILSWLALALLVQTTLVPIVAGGGAPVDLALIVVVFAALNRGPVAGLWTGTLAGLLQDALSGGIIGVSGLTKTMIGVLVGVVGSHFLLGTVWHRLAVLVGASLVHGFCYLGIYTLIGPDGSAFVSEFQIVERLQKFTPARESVQVEIRGAGHGPREFNRAEGLSLDANGKLYVADSCNHRVQVFDGDGIFLREHGGPGTARGKFSYPYDVRVDEQGRQYVCEFGNSRVTVLDADDHVLEIIGTPGSGLGQFNNPWSLALDSHGNLYVADSQNHRVQKLIRREPASEF